VKLAHTHTHTHTHTHNAHRLGGVDKSGFGYGGTGKRSNNKQFESYGETFGLGDVIGCLLDLDAGTIAWRCVRVCGCELRVCLHFIPSIHTNMKII
jgi:hypothetical protein